MDELNTDDLNTPATALPQTYYLPRNGALKPVCVSDWNDLYPLRTELELLRRINRFATLGHHAGDGDPTRPRPIPAKYSADDRRELTTILRDAAHPAVEEMAALVDVEFPEIRKEIVMSVVNDEAQRIVHETHEAGAARSMSIIADPPATTESLADQVDQALAKAEEELTAALANMDDQHPQTVVQGPPAGSPNPSKPPPHAIPADSNRAAGTGDARASDPARSRPRMPKPVARPIRPSGMLRPSARRVERMQPPPTNGVDSPGGESRGSGDENPSRRTERAVSDIERGIHQLAGILEQEVNGQWREAREALATVGDARTKIDDAVQHAWSMVDEITGAFAEMTHANDQLRAARDEAVATRDQLRRVRGEVSGEADELRATRNELRAALEEARTARDAIRATKDDLRSAREEVRSTSGDLRAAHETLCTARDDARAIGDETRRARDAADAAAAEAKLLREDARRAKERAETSADAAALAADQASRETRSRARPNASQDSTHV